MLTKYYIEIDGEKAEVPKGCLRNWDEIKCVYKRADFSGVTRSFTTQFEFVGEMYDRLMALYLRDGVNASATLTLCTITNEWQWEEQFTCELDFSSISWDNYTVKINCIDDSLASAIKAKKGTTYEFVVGQDIPVADTLQYDRLTMRNSVNHAITSNGDETDGDAAGGGHTDGSVVLVESTELKRVPIYVVGDAETYENSPLLFDDESDESGSFFIKLEKTTPNLQLDVEINYFGQACTSYLVNGEIYLMRFDDANPEINSNYLNLGTVFSFQRPAGGWFDRECVGCYPSLAALKEAYPNPPQDVYAIIGSSDKKGECSAIYFTPITLNASTEWIQGEITWYSIRGGVERAQHREHRFISHFDLSNQPAGSKFALVYKAKVGLSGRPPKEAEKHFAIKSKIKTTWESKAKTISIDALSPATVLKSLMDKITDGKKAVDVQIKDTDSRIAKTYLFAAESVRDIPGAKLYTSFNDFCNWMETVFGYTYYIDGLTIRFVPRAEIFAGNKTVTLSNIRDLSFSLNTGLAYSALKIGYEKQEYEAECGRDEWNFSTEYTTGLDKADKTLSLISKYRADCYGLEFLAQNRAKDTKDNKADKTIFFAYCAVKVTEEDSVESRDDGTTEVTQSTSLVIDRTGCVITGALSPDVFNGEYAPRLCAKANGSYINAALCPMALTFASSEGNTEVSIDGVKGNADLQLDERLFTLGEIQFTSPDVDTKLDVNALYEIRTNGVVYRGFLKEVSFKYAKAETVTYKLIVKEIEL